MRHKAVYYSASSLYMFYPSSVVHKSVIAASGTGNTGLPPTWPSLATLEGGICTKNMTSTGGCS